MEHCLKTWPEWFNLTKEGKKTYELRFNDRNFKEGDILVLKEYNPTSQEYTGNEIRKIIGHSMEDTSYIAPGFILMSLYDPR